MGKNESGEQGSNVYAEMGFCINNDATMPRTTSQMDSVLRPAHPPRLAGPLSGAPELRCPALPSSGLRRGLARSGRQPLLAPGSNSLSNFPSLPLLVVVSPAPSGSQQWREAGGRRRLIQLSLQAAPPAVCGRRHTHPSQKQNLCSL